MYVNIHALNTDFAPKWPLLLPLSDHIKLCALVLKYSSWILTYLPIHILFISFDFLPSQFRAKWFSGFHVELPQVGR